METKAASPLEPKAARAGLQDAAAARGRTANRSRSPWWYRTGMGLSLAIASVAISIGGDAATLGVPAALILIPTALVQAAKRITGVSIDRYRARSSEARRLLGGYGLALLALFSVGMVLQIATGLRWSMAIAGAAMLALTVVIESRLDDILCKDIRAGHDRSRPGPGACLRRGHPRTQPSADLRHAPPGQLPGVRHRP